MLGWTKGYKYAGFLIIILFLLTVVNIMVLLDVPIARQLLGFSFFSFVPGIIVMEMLGLDELDLAEKVLLSIGLSVAFLMLGGCAINEFYLRESVLFGPFRPLSSLPLLVFLDSFVLVGAFLVYLKAPRARLATWGNKGAHAKGLPMYAVVMLLGILPMITILGTTWVNALGNNVILLFVTVAIPLVFAVGAIFQKLLPSKLYAFALFVVVIALLYSSSLISNRLVSFGSDSHLELFIFKTTQKNGFWSSSNPIFLDLGYGRVNAMLSVTVLPTIYSNLLNIDSTWTFKLLYPLIFSLVPLGLFQIWKTHLGEKYAFLSAFFFIAEATFYNEMLGLNRQIVAEVFFVLLLFVLLSDKIKPLGKTVCFVIFSLALVTSHYGAAEIFLFFLVCTYVSLRVTRKATKNITLFMVVFFTVTMFSWYVYVSNSTVFESILGYGRFVYGQLGEFFNPAARGATVLTGLGLGTAPSILNAVHRGFVYITEILIVIGFVGLITHFVKPSIKREYFLFTLWATALLGLCILLPGFAGTLNITRFYHILLFFLAPLCILGAETLFKFTYKRRIQTLTVILTLVILTSYFLFESGFVFEITKSDSWSIGLSKYRMDPFRLYAQLGFVDEQSVFGAQWLSKRINVDNTKVFSDSISRDTVLLSYGLLPSGYIEVLANTTQASINGVVYLSGLNTIGRVIVGDQFVWNSSEFSSSFNEMNKVYSNGISEIYRTASKPSS